MRDDLLDAKSAVDWAISQFPSLGDRIEAWLRANVDMRIEDVPAPATHDWIVVIEKESFPLAFNVEVGAYLNTIRSSLDLLASALARRHSVLKPEDSYFPVANSAALFDTGSYKGSKFVNGLPPIDRGKIEALKPYQGGHPMLYALHQLDIMRKHRRLIYVEPRPLIFTMGVSGPDSQDFIPNPNGFLRANEKTIIGRIRKGAAHDDMKLRPYVALSETNLVRRAPIIAVLYQFARMADEIIALFDTP